MTEPEKTREIKADDLRLGTVLADERVVDAVLRLDGRVEFACEGSDEWESKGLDDPIVVKLAEDGF